MLTYGVGNTFCFYFHCFPVFVCCPFRILPDFLCMEFCVCNLMDACFGCLCFAHALFNTDRVVQVKKISFPVPLHFLITDWNRGNPFKRFHKILIIFHIPMQLIHTQAGKLFSVRLRIIKHCDNTKCGYLYLHFLHDGHPVLIKHRLFRYGINLFLFLFYLIGCGRKDTDTFLPFVYMALKILLPCLVPSNECRIRTLHRYKLDIVCAVIMEF